jgi:hypothetical protein
MSVSSILAFVLAGVAAKNRRADRQDEKQGAELIALRIDNADLRRRVEELEGDVARANVQYRRDQELIDIWRERARPPPHVAQQQAQAQLLQSQAAQQMQQMQQAQGLQNHTLAQYNAQQAMNAQNFYADRGHSHGLGAPIGLLGAQNLIDAELFCNCVPSRSQVWATTDPE